MRTILLTTALLLAAASPVSAKLLVKIEVQVEGNSSGEIESSLRAGMEARLNSTERYAVTTNALATVLLMNVTCLMLRSEVGYTNGIVCNSEVSYFPYTDSGLATLLESAGHMAVAGPHNITFIIEALMNDFINGTTDAVLAERKGFMRQSVRLVCASHPEECKAAK